MHNFFHQIFAHLKCAHSSISAFSFQSLKYRFPNVLVFLRKLLIYIHCYISTLNKKYYCCVKIPQNCLITPRDKSSQSGLERCRIDIKQSPMVKYDSLCMNYLKWTTTPYDQVLKNILHLQIINHLICISFDLHVFH
jgi:hypothetical protein